MEQLIEIEVLKDRDVANEKWYVRYNFFKKKRIGFSVFISSGLIMISPLFSVTGIDWTYGICFKSFSIIAAYYYALHIFLALLTLTFGLLMGL